MFYALILSIDKVGMNYIRKIILDFSSLETTSVSNRKNLLAEIEALIKKYSDLPDAQNRIEEY